MIKSPAPKLLFHCSPNQHLDELTPKNETIRSHEDGPVVFASSDKRSALKHIFKSNDSWTQLAVINGVHIALIACKKEDFIKNDHGGACYTLNSNNFQLIMANTESKDEWIARSPVKPISKQTYPSALEAMIDAGIYVYFVSPQELELFRHSQNKVYVVKRLQSENECRGLNPPIFA